MGEGTARSVCSMVFINGCPSISVGPEFPGASLQAKPAGADDVLVTSRIASAAEALIRRLDSPSAVTDALQALLAGDLTQPDTNGADAATLAPFYPPGKATSVRLESSSLLCDVHFILGALSAAP